ncbi:MAG: hypothetical protein KDJ19_07075 [Hyphomicrobiaceae bacterium]|nr:hypothetical protein [Hyphomicrobiaceae bacterium]MCC0023991.1 hypothetical protein [Hyphomicrobiaceae bacterium]
MPTRPDHHVNWPLVLFGWLLASLLLAARATWFSADIPLVADTDDAMRLTVVRDLLMGQNWFDHVQHRLDFPFGGSIHWSRLIDLPIAGLTLLFSPFMADPLMGAAYVWPLLLFGVLLALSAMMSAELIGKEASLPAIVLPALSAVVMVEFAPGRVDHHSVQIILALLTVLATIKSWRHIGWAIVAGIAASTAIAIGTESLPIVVAAVATYAIMWVIHPDHGGNLRYFGISFGLASLVHLAIAQPPSLWLAPMCDALSITYVAAAIGVALVLAVLPAFPLRSWWTRLGAGVLLGGALVAGLVILFPQCLAGPYAGMDPWLAENWLGRIIEAKPIWHSLLQLPAYTIGIAVPPLLALLVIGLKITMGSKHRRAEWLVLGLYLALGIAVMILQVRGARLLAPLAVPAGALTIVAFRRRFIANKSIPDALGLVASWIGFTGIAVASIASLIIPAPGNAGATSGGDAGSKYACLQPDAYIDLAGLPPEVIMAPVDLGSHILLYTPHSIIGAPYHRAQDGVFDTFRFFNGPPDEARAIAGKRRISLVVTCPWLGEMTGFDNTDPNSFVALFAKGEVPDWLVDQSIPGQPLRVYSLKD